MLLKVVSITAFLLTFGVANAAGNDKSAVPKGDEVENSKNQLKALDAKLQLIRVPIEKFLLYGWIALEDQVTAVVNSIDRNHGVGNDETSEAYRNLVDQIESSKDYFISIETPGTKADIEAIQTMSDEIRAAKKMKGTLLSRNTFKMFDQIRGLMDTLKGLPISNQLRTGLQDLDPQIIAVLAQDKAQGGDRWLTYQQGRQAVAAIRKIYPLFMEAGVDNQTFLIVSRIQAINEQYAFIVNMAIQQKADDGEKR